MGRTAGVMTNPSRSQTRARPGRSPDELVADRASAIVILQPATCTLQGRFVGLDAETLTLELFGEPVDVPPGSVACVYAAERRDVAFLAPVRRYGVADGVPVLTVQRPEEIARMDRRRAFRVPVPEGALTARLSFGTASATGWLADLSMFGAQLVLQAADGTIGVGHRVVLVIDDEDGEVVVHGRVVRRTAGGCGLSFTPGPDGKPVPRVAALVGRMEREWLRRQRGANLVGG